MSNGDATNNRLEFQERIKKLPPEDRSLETALMVYDLGLKFDECIDPKTSRKVGAISGSVAGTFVAIVIGIIQYFTKP